MLLYSVLLSCFIEISVINTNGVDPDRVPHFSAPDLDLHCLPMSLLLDARLNPCSQNIFENSVDPDETAHHEPSHQDLFCLPICLDF